MKAILILLAAVAFAIAPFLSPEFGGFDADRYPVPQEDPPVQPAGWAFSIWGVIYLGLIVHAVLGVMHHKNDPEWDAGRLPLLISLSVGVIWLPVALVSPVWATILIWVMLLTALYAMFLMRVAKPLWAIWPVALYAGWLSAASFVSIGLFLAGFGFTDALTAAVIALVAALGFAVVSQYTVALWPYGVAVAWGFLGIAAANKATSTFVAALALIAALIMIGLALRASRRASL